MPDTEIEIDVEGFETVEYHNEDVDTDRGVWRQRWFSLVFKNKVINMSEFDFYEMLEVIFKKFK